MARYVTATGRADGTWQVLLLRWLLLQLEIRARVTLAGWLASNAMRERHRLIQGREGGGRPAAFQPVPAVGRLGVCAACVVCVTV